MELGLCKSNIIQGKINIGEMNNENGVLISQSIQLKNGQAMNVSRLKVGDVIIMADPRGTGSNEQIKLKVVGILDKMPLVYTGGSDKYGIITTEEVFKKITGIQTYSRFDIIISRTADQASIAKKLKYIADRVEEGRMLSFIDTSYSTLQTEMGVILYGLVVVISIIGALNIINTISTNLILRISEFGTLRAIGMTPGQIKGMIRLEGIFYGLISSFYGSIAGCALARVLYDNVNKIKGLTWHLPWKAAVEACIVAIVIGVTASLVPLKKISKMNVVESIRAEE
jgi:putative ABC transport system permease protein